MILETSLISSSQFPSFVSPAPAGGQDAEQQQELQERRSPWSVAGRLVSPWGHGWALRPGQPVLASTVLCPCRLRHKKFTERPSSCAGSVLVEARAPLPSRHHHPQPRAAPVLPTQRLHPTPCISVNVT